MENDKMQKTVHCSYGPFVITGLDLADEYGGLGR